MKKLFSIFMAVILSITVVGCSSSDSKQSESETQTETEYNQYMADGKSRVIDEEYDKAKEFFKLALEDKNDDKEATNLIKQIDLFKEVIDLNEGEHGAYFSAIEKLIEIEKIDTNTDVIKNKAIDYRKSVINNIDSTIDYEEELINNGEYKKAKNDLEGIIEECEKYDVLQDQLDRCKKLLITCNEKIKEVKNKQNQLANNSNKSTNKSTKKSSKKNNTFTREKAKQIIEEEFDGMSEYDSAKDYDNDHESYYVLADESHIRDGKECYHVTLWNYVSDEDYWMHMSIDVFENREFY